MIAVRQEPPWFCAGVHAATVSTKAVGTFNHMHQRILHARPEAADLLAISVRKLDQLIKTKLLRGIKIGKRTLIAHAELERFARCGTAKNRGHRGE